MFIPYSTDAPIYHLPIATVGLIVVNTFVFMGMVAGNIDFMEWAMPYGQGFTPQQWLTSAFTHIGPVHLVGNMIFLWVFGIVVEGKIGWWKFLIIYLLIAVLQSAMEQAIQLSATEPGFSVGASSAIYGIMAIAAVWAPRNEITIFYWVLFIVTGTGDVPILWFAFFYIGWDVVGTLWAGFASSSWLHVGGVLIGAPIGVAMVKLKLVDCEGWDIFHVLADDGGAKKEKRKKHEQRVEEQKLKMAETLREAPKQIAWLLEQGNPSAAYTQYRKLNDLGGGIELPRDVLLRLIAGLHQEKRWRESCPLMAEALERFPEGSEAVRVKLAQICLVELERPAKALDVLHGLDVQKLPAKLVPLTKKIAQRAQQMQRAGHVELDSDPW